MNLSLRLIFSGTLLISAGVAARASNDSLRELTWARGIEGQRKADRGDGTYLNPPGRSMVL